METMLIKLLHLPASALEKLQFQRPPLEQCLAERQPINLCRLFQLSACVFWGHPVWPLQVLPEITERWRYNGSTVVANGRHAGRAADVWAWRVDDDQGYGTYHNVYTFLAGRVRIKVIFKKVSSRKSPNS